MVKISFAAFAVLATMALSGSAFATVEPMDDMMKPMGDMMKPLDDMASEKIADKIDVEVSSSEVTEATTFKAGGAKTEFTTVATCPPGSAPSGQCQCSVEPTGTGVTVRPLIVGAFGKIDYAENTCTCTFRASNTANGASNPGEAIATMVCIDAKIVKV